MPILQPSDAPIPFPLPFFVVPVAGTHGRDDTWYLDGSAWLAALGRIGVHAARVDGRPLRWTGHVNGLDIWADVRRLFSSKAIAVSHVDWEALADAAAYYLLQLPYEQRNVVAHSHAGQGLFYCCASGVRIRSLTTVGTPVRADMAEVYEAARPSIGYHLHICDASWDLMGSLGALFDGDVRWSRLFPTGRRDDGTLRASPDLQYTLKGISHSKVLHDPAAIAYWQSEAWIDRLRLGVAGTRAALALVPGAGATPAAGVPPSAAGV